MALKMTIHQRNQQALGATDKDAMDRDFRLRAQSVLAVDEMIGALQAAVQPAGRWTTPTSYSARTTSYHMGEHRLMPGEMTAYDTDIHVPLVVPGPARDRSDPDLPAARSGNPPTYAALRTRTDLYVEYETGEHEYHDLSTDLYELHNTHPLLAPEHRAVLETALAAIQDCHDATACWAAQHVDPRRWREAGKSEEHRRARARPRSHARRPHRPICWMQARSRTTIGLCLRTNGLASGSCSLGSGSCRVVEVTTRAGRRGRSQAAFARRNRRPSR
jgi:hypothetical protein